MAINPSISLGVQPPVIQPLQIQNPLEQYAKIQTLRQLMQQGQLRDLQTQQAQQELEQGRLAAEGEASFRKLYSDPNATPTQSQVYGALGPKGAAVVKTQGDIAKSQEERQENYMRLIGQAALNSKTQQDRDFRINALAKGGVIPQEMAAQMLAQPFNLEETRAYGESVMTAAEQLREKREADARAFAEKKQPFELRTAAAGATKAEQEAAGTQPITLQQKAQAEAQLWTDPGGLIAIMNDPNRSDADKQRAAAGYQKHEGLKRAGAATNNIITPNQNIANEAKLRDDYSKDTKEYVTIRNAYNKIVGAAQSKSAAGDMSLVYGFMKLQDPGSTVREGERADAQNAGGVEERVRAIWNKLKDGQSLDPSVRADFVAQAEKIHTQQYADYLKTKDMYTGIAQRGGMDPRNVVIDYSTAKPAGGAGGGHVIEVNGKHYRYKGSGATDDMANYTEVTK